MIVDLISAATKFGIDQQMLQQGIMEIMAGKETPTVDQIMQMIEQANQQQQQQQEQMAAQQQQMMMQNQENAAMANEAMNAPVTGDEVFQTGVEGGPTLGGGAPMQATGDETFETGMA